MLLADAYANAAINAAVALLNGGFLDIYDGSQPATGNTPVAGQTKLASLGFGSPAFGAASAGVAAANAITPDSDNDASGNASWARLWKSDHTTPVCDLSVGVSGCDINLDSVAIVQHGTTSLGSLTLALPE